ncbi:hypothetical protein J8I87_09570 [Paraburkholderia sp. LEh10]|uniref:hypothetical protein n=1 Tax=Paraburkholderia sp. LEh10 TaxID=2821353 RepID=UPI001AE38E78|nr:hypothetical protein [Paraburkholderia sp. LEh10]MBP0589965.1 hypothetical protein [Paraburkholderia sp. LEh10]
MNTPRIKEPTKKAFHFPKSAKEPSAEAKKPSAKSSRASDAKKAAPAAEPAASPPEAANAAPKTTKAKAVKTTKAARPAQAAKGPKEAKATKVKAAPAAEEKKPRAKKEKEKVVRDSFTMPKSDYAKIAELKQRCLDAGVSVKKSELLRAGLNLLAVSPAKRLVAAVQELEAVKTGRPAKS